MNRTKLIQDCKDVFTARVWSVDTSGMSKLKKNIVRRIKLLRITISTFAENRMGFQCVALAYFVTLAIVPLFAFVFAISGGLGLSDEIQPLLLRIFPQYPGAVSLIVEKAKNIIHVAMSGWVGFFSAVLFLWTIIWLMFQVERVFNNIWGIRRIPRKIYKRFGFYLVLLLILPFFVLGFAGGIALTSNATNLLGFDFKEARLIIKFLLWLGIFADIVITLYVMYHFIPVTKVNSICAFKASVVASLVFLGFQFLYLKTQIFVTRLDAVYGALAAIPLFLIWLNISWQIIMYGAQLSYSYQNIDHYNLK